MRTFEIGKRYRDGAATFEIIGRTAKTVRFVMIQHAGHFNERKGDEKLGWQRSIFYKLLPSRSIGREKL